MQFYNSSLNFGKKGVITFNETKRLLTLRDSENKSERNKAINELIRGNVGLVYSIIDKGSFSNQGLDKDDLVMSGIEGLYKAIRKANLKVMDEKHVTSFSSYASFYIREALFKNLRESGANGSNLSDYKYRMARKLYGVASFINENSCETISEDKLYKMAAKEMGMKEKDAVLLKTTSSLSYSLSSIIDENSDESKTYEELFSANKSYEVESSNDTSLLFSLIDEAFKSLSKVDVDILERRFGFKNYLSSSLKQESFQSIASSYNKTRAWASNRCKLALKKLAKNYPHLEDFLYSAI